MKQDVSTLLFLDDIPAELSRRAGKRLSLRIYPVTGRVRIAAPRRMPLSAIHAFALSKLDWIKKHRTRLINILLQTQPEADSVYLWGKPYKLVIKECRGAHHIDVGENTITLSVRPNTPPQRHAALLKAWYRGQLREALSPLVAKWQERLQVRLRKLDVRDMTSRWGSCTPSKRTIRLNAALVHKPPECLEYVLVHELCHFFVRGHGTAFYRLMDRHLPQWQSLRHKLNT